MKKTKVYKNAKAEKAIMESYADLLTMWDTKISELENAESLRFHLSLGFEETNRIICFKKEL